MRRYRFDVPMSATVTVEAETEQEAIEKADEYLDKLQPYVGVDQGQSPSFEAFREIDEPIELLDEEEI